MLLSFYTQVYNDGRGPLARVLRNELALRTLPLSADLRTPAFGLCHVTCLQLSYCSLIVVLYSGLISDQHNMTIHYRVGYVAILRRMSKNNSKLSFNAYECLYKDMLCLYMSRSRVHACMNVFIHTIIMC